MVSENLSQTAIVWQYLCDPDRKYLPFGEKIVKIGPVDTEIALLIVKKETKLEMRGKA